MRYSKKILNIYEILLDETKAFMYGSGFIEINEKKLFSYNKILCYF